MTTLRTWKAPPLIPNPWLRYAFSLGVVAYLWLATASIEVNWLRVYEGLDRGAAFLASEAARELAPVEIAK
ncbi:hypothetical protein [Chrysiogenes arsenatis]|uniref:hypothetical protein n=1 Tax=Chrysiogenes arsenatis TaxID=309797 RepID=UPI0003FEF7FB|nr:hypothetical protein [Chrysiogenes arsenatis]